MQHEMELLSGLLLLLLFTSLHPDAGNPLGLVFEGVDLAEQLLVGALNLGHLEDHVEVVAVLGLDLRRLVQRRLEVRQAEGVAAVVAAVRTTGGGALLLLLLLLQRQQPVQTLRLGGRRDEDEEGLQLGAWQRRKRRRE